MIFQALDYPITGEIKQNLLMVEWITAFLFFEFAFLFYIRRKSQKQDLKFIQEKGFIYIGIGYFFMWIFKIIGDYYIEDPNIRPIFMNLSIFCFIGGILSFIYIMDKYKLIYFKKYGLSNVFLILAIIYIVGTLIADLLSSILLLAYLPLLMIYLTSYLKKLKSIYFKKKEFKKYRLSAFLFILGIILVFVGYTLSSDMIRKNLRFYLTIRFIGDFFQIAGELFLGIFYLYIPSISEFQWRENVDGVLIMHTDGLPIYKKIYEEKLDKLGAGLITGIVASAKMFLEMHTKKKGTSIIKQQDKTLIIYSGENISGVLICEESLLAPQILLKNFMERIEMSYHEVLKTWKGDLKIFKPLEQMFEEIFG